MTVQVTWDSDERRIVRFLYDENWTWEEFFAAIRQTKDMAESAPSNVGIIMEATSNHLRFPPNMVTHLKNALRNRHPKSKIVVVTIQNTFLRTIIRTIAKLSGKDGSDLKIADTFEEARQLIETRLNELENLKASNATL